MLFLFFLAKKKISYTQKKITKFQLWAQGALQCALIVPIRDD